MLVGGLTRGAVVLAGWLPLPLLHALGWLAGTLLWIFPNTLRRVSLRNLELCLPGLDARGRRRLARASLIHSMRSALEAPAIWFGPRWRVARWLDDPPAQERLRQVLGAGGVLLATHQGAWELVARFGARLGPLTVLYKPQKGALDALVRAGRERSPEVQAVPTTAGGVKALVAALARGERIGVLPDHDPPEGSGVFAPFFGFPAHTMDLPCKLAQRSGLPACFVVAERRPWARGFRFHVLPLALPAAAGVDAAAELNRGVERCIHCAPDQYWWGYRRFRRRPPGVPDPYQSGA